MIFRTLYVTGKLNKIPGDWEVKHTSLIEPKNRKPYFCVLLQKEERKEDKTARLGYRV